MYDIGLQWAIILSVPDATSLSPIVILDSVGSVSYTHLDVYKRQALFTINKNSTHAVEFTKSQLKTNTYDRFPLNKLLADHETNVNVLEKILASHNETFM